MFGGKKTFINVLLNNGEMNMTTFNSCKIGKEQNKNYGSK